MTRDDAIRKALACLRLAKSSNANEAALAAAKAQEIMDRFALDTEALDYTSTQDAEDKEEIKDFDNDVLDANNKYDAVWTVRLGSVVSHHNQCRIYLTTWRTGKKEIKVVGRPSSVQTVRYMYSYLKAEVEKLRKANTVGQSTCYRYQYCLGVVEAISVKLHEQAKATVAAVQGEQANNPLALMRVNNAVAKMQKRGEAVQKFMDEKMKLNKGRASYLKTNTGGRSQGYRDGKSIRIGAAKGAVTSGAKALAG